MFWTTLKRTAGAALVATLGIGNCEDFIRDEYMPATRQQIGLLSATEGLDFYEKTLKAQISVDCKSIA